MNNFRNFSSTLFLSNNNRLSNHILVRGGNLVKSFKQFETITNWTSFAAIAILAELNWNDYDNHGYHLLSELLKYEIPFEGKIAMYSAEYESIYEMELTDYQNLMNIVPLKSAYADNGRFNKHFLMNLYYRNYSRLVDEYHRLLLY